MDRIDFSDFKEKVLEDTEIRTEYENLKPIYELRKKLIELRQKNGLTQEEVAEKLHTQKSNISRLENVNTKNSPKLSTIQEYANAMGYDVQIDFCTKTLILNLIRKKLAFNKDFEQSKPFVIVFAKPLSILREVCH